MIYNKCAAARLWSSTRRKETKFAAKQTDYSRRFDNEGSKVGELVDSHRWSEKEHCVHYYKENTEFKKKFGINEYEDISEATQKDIHAFVKNTRVYNKKCGNSAK